MSSEDDRIHNRNEWHEVILRLAGQLYDDDLVLARNLLADGQEDLVARVIYKALRPGNFELPQRDATRLLQLFSVSRIADAEGIVGIRGQPGLPKFRYSPASPAGEDAHESYDGDAEEQAIMAVAPHCGVRELYRAWRYSPVSLLENRRIYLAKADPDADLAGIAGRLQEELTQAGDPSPQVEVYSREDQLTQYHHNVYENSETLWLDADLGRVRLAELFDGFDAAGEPFFTSDHERIHDPGERGALLKYLRSGMLIQPGAAPQDDIIDRSQVGAVPDGLQTDGEWIWAAGAPYYLEHYYLSPDPGLRDHIVSRNGPMLKPDESELRNARMFLIKRLSNPYR